MQLTQALHRNRQLWPYNIAVQCGTRARTWTQFNDRVARLAAALHALGVTPGDRIGILALNSERYIESYYAIWWAGAAVNPVNIRWSEREIAYSLDDCDTRVLLVDDHFAAMAARLCASSASLQTLIHIGDGEGAGDALEYEKLIAAHLPIEDSRRSGRDLAGVFYTGGTTGFPKGVMLSHSNLLSNALICLIVSPITPEDRGLLAVPAFHISGAGMIVRFVMSGCTQLVLPSFDSLAAAQAIAREGITVTMLVPTMLQMLIDHPDAAECDLDSLRTVIYGGSPINEAVLDRILARLPLTRFYQAFGQTELSPCISYLTHDYHTATDDRRDKLRSAGRALPGCDLRIVDAEDRDVPRGSVGEIVARGPGVMLGYWNRPEQTAQALRDGWMHMGDAGYMDEEGFVFVVDRIKDMIVSGGENVYSAEVEQALAQHAAVAASAVIGIPSERWGESVHAIVVLRPGATATVEELIVHCRTLIAGYKCPRSIEFQAALPMSGVGKVLKHELRKPFWRAQGRSVA